MSPADFFPHLRPWVENLANAWPAYIIKPQFASWEVGHILSLVILGGCSIILNLRLIGVGVTSEPPSEIRRNLWPWMHVGVIGIVVSGVLIGMANAERLYDSAAFTVKMLCLLAAVIFTYGVVGPAAKADGILDRRAKVLALVGLAAWLAALFVFTTAKLINPGMFHMLTAAALIVMFVARGSLRWVYLSVLVLLATAMFVLTHLTIDAYDFAKADPTNKAFAWLYAVWIFGVAGWQIAKPSPDPDIAASDPDVLTKLAGYATILMWVTAAAAGRWIAFA